MNASVTAGAAASAPGPAIAPRTASAPGPAAGPGAAAEVAPAAAPRSGPAITPGNAPVPRLAESAPAPDPAFGTAGVRVAAP